MGNSSFKMLHTISGFGAHSGGTSTCTYDLISSMHHQGADVDLLTLKSKDPSDKLMGKGEAWIHALPNDTFSPFGYSANMKRWIEEKHEVYNLLHVNGLWMYANHITCALARKYGKPYVITPHGMLYPDALHRSYWKKWPIRKLFFEKDIREASCLHATCKQEMEYIRAFGFLGRLHPIKKVENLFYGDELLKERQQECELWIMGGGMPEYEAFLKAEVKRLGLDNVKFLGFVNGREKYEKLAQLSALFVPSDFENFGMIVTEALSVGTPVMASLGTPWESLNEEHCGWWVERSPENIAKVMREVLDMSADELDDMGERGKKMVKQRFAADHVAMMMEELYIWLLNGGEKPAFVYEK